LILPLFFFKKGRIKKKEGSKKRKDQRGRIKKKEGSKRKDQKGRIKEEGSKRKDQKETLVSFIHSGSKSRGTIKLLK